jgi:CubicO group peptidase (beta-lactamase class C family)
VKTSSTQFTVAAVLALGILHPAWLSAQMSPQVDNLFTAYEKGKSPGCSVGVVQNGSFVYRKAHGFGSLELSVPLSPESVFYMGSVSKQFTAASVVLAAKLGFLALDDDIHTFIPELPDYGHPVTLRQMLHQTSGFRDFFTLLYMAGRQDSGFRARDVLDLVVHQKNLNNEPGKEFIYSNTNYFLLGVVIERATGRTLAQFAKENIFQPLGMTHTRFADDRTVVIPDRIAAYDPGPGETFLSDWSTAFDVVGAGGLMSSVDDMRLWENNFREDRLGKGTLMIDLQVPGVLNDGNQISYALGLELGTYRGVPTVGHNGSLFGYRTEVLRLPKQDLSIICLCNLSSAPTGSLVRQIADLYLPPSLKADTARRPAQLGEALPDPSLFAGEYLDQRTHTLFSFTAAKGDLVGWGTPLRRTGPNTFNDLGTGTITFSPSRQSMTATLTMDGETAFAGSRVAGVRLNNTELAALSGTYSSSELEQSYRLTLQESHLILHNGSNTPVLLTPITGTEFEAGDLGTIVFQWGGDKRILGFSVFSGNVRGLIFTREISPTRSPHR